MSTTVPQNMKGMKIAGRHTPTRNSLRHSRMIVVNHKNHDSKYTSCLAKLYDGVCGCHTVIVDLAKNKHISISITQSLAICTGLQATRNLNISRQLLVMQLAVGLFIVGLAAWILILAPNASILINPYLSGLSVRWMCGMVGLVCIIRMNLPLAQLLLASIAGLILLRRDHKITEHRPQTNSCYKVLLAESYVFTGLALIFCCLALVCAAIEFAELISSADGECGPTSSSLLSYHNCTCLAAGEVVANYSSEAPMAFAVGQEEASQ